MRPLKRLKNIRKLMIVLLMIGCCNCLHLSTATQLMHRAKENADGANYLNQKTNKNPNNFNNQVVNNHNDLTERHYDDTSSSWMSECAMTTTTTTTNHSIRHFKHKNKKLTRPTTSKQMINNNNCQNSTSSSIFITENSTLVTAQTGSTAVLPCILSNIVNGVVSWKRLSDYTLLTVGSTRYTTSVRFVPEQSKTFDAQHWRLLIKFAEHNDAGWYECQVSTYPPSHIRLRLRITDAYAIIQGGTEMYIRNGSRMHLTCRFVLSTEEPSYVFWYHEHNMINFEFERGVHTWKNQTGSGLTIAVINHSHSGNYTCVPSNTKPASISVHILDDEKPAAMHTDNRNCAKSRISAFISTSSSAAFIGSILIIMHHFLINPSHYHYYLFYYR